MSKALLITEILKGKVCYSFFTRRGQHYLRVIFVKILKRLFVAFYVVLCAFVFALSGIVFYYSGSIDSTYKITRGSDFIIETRIPVTAEYKGALVSQCEEIDTVGSTLDVDVKLFGLIPIKNTTLEVVEETYVAVLGSPFGIKMYTDGVLVVDTGSINTASGSVNPANKAGIKTGDYILSVNGEKVETNEDVGKIVEQSNGQTLTIVVRREDKNITVYLTPALSSDDNCYRAGIWVKDSTAGIGMLTFYSPYNDMICGLGHAVYDSGTGNIIDFCRGELVGAEIISIVKGTSGAPGELKGKLNYKSVGKLYGNLINGIYGAATCVVDTSNLTQVAHKQDVKDGAATIICTVDENGPQSYSCQIKLASVGVNNTVQDMTVVITDERLIELTGGIVQGMSGSPIIQNGKLVGVLTHVLIDNPQKGYGIFAENMLETAQRVANKQLKDVS